MLAVPGASIARAGSVGQKAAAGVATGGGLGAAEGAVYGYGLGEEGTRGASAAHQAVVQALLGAGIGGAVHGWCSPRVAQRKEAVNAAPSLDELTTKATDLYRRGETTGKTAARGYTQRLQGSIRDIAQSQGLISPTGRLSTSYPKVSEALKMVDDYAGQKMTPEQMRQVRRTLQDAAQSADGAEARIGTQMLKRFDEFVEPMVPEFREAE